ncbi:hypothetical protein [Chamaesiphon sp.]|uniref:hypothetical protein n=1 Tax=Chamaesiphon sp. TaxID=2814140 RepID=UPI003592E99A
MKNNFNSYFKRAFKIAYNVENILPLICSSLVLTFFFGLIQELIKKRIGTSESSLLILLFSTFFIAILAPFAIALGLRHTAKAKPDRLLASKDKPLPRKGLILLVSNEKPCQVAIDFHLQQGKLKQCWLICSIESLATAQAIQSFNKDRIVIDNPIVINDVNDPISFMNVIDLIYTNAAKPPEKWQESDIISEYTGMTAHGSVGMALVCNANNRSLQYTPAVRDNTGKVIGSAEPIEIKLKYSGFPPPESVDRGIAPLQNPSADRKLPPQA